jgi:hypothetical protein
MSVDTIQNQIDALDYWDAPVLKVECGYFADEVTIVYGDENGNVEYTFRGCYKCVFDHVKEYNKVMRVRDMTYPQIPYFMQDVKVSKSVDDMAQLLVCKINMFPLYIEIWCKDIGVIRRGTKETD